MSENESKFTHEEMQPMKVEYDPALEGGIEIDLLKWLDSLPETQYEAASLGTLTKSHVENMMADIFQEMIEKMEKK